MPTTRNPRQRNTDNQVQISPNEAGKLPPQAIDLEEAVIGALMLEKDAYSTVSEILIPNSFYKPEHQKIFEAIRNLAQKQQPIDMLTVKQELSKLGYLEEVGGASVISALTQKVTSSAHIEYHARIIAQKFLARELIRVSTEIERGAFDEQTDVDKLMQDAEGKIFEISQKNLKKDVTQIGPVLQEALAHISEARSRKDGLSGVATGFTRLDNLTSGWQKSDLVIIAARPAMGKTAFVLSMAKNMATDFNSPVAIFSLEMSNVQLVNRILMNVTGISGDKIKSGKLSEEEWQIMTEKVNEIDDLPIFIDDTPSLSVFELRTKARRLVREHKVQCIIIDYLQLMNASGMTFGSREQEISIISRSLKGLAKELSIPIIALSQLNRGVETRSGNEKRPQLADLRESGAIEQDADIVCFIHRPEYYKITEDDKGQSLIGIAEIIVAKHRSGAVDDIRLRFIKENAKFDNLEYDYNSSQRRSNNFERLESKTNEENFNSEIKDTSMPF